MPVRKPVKFGASMKTSDLIAGSKGMFLIGRHTDRGGSAPSGITPEGEIRAEWAAKNLPKGAVLHVLHPKKPRHTATAGIVYRTYPGEKGVIKELDTLNFDRYVKNMGEFERLIETIGDPRVTQMWVNGELNKIADEPIQIGRTILADVREQFHANEIKGKKNLMVAITSSGAEGAIMRSLGINPAEFRPKRSMSKETPKPGDLLRYTEAMLFFVGPKNELIMKFRGRAFKIVQKPSGLVAIKV